MVRTCMETVRISITPLSTYSLFPREWEQGPLIAENLAVVGGYTLITAAHWIFMQLFCDPGVA